MRFYAHSSLQHLVLDSSYRGPQYPSGERMNEQTNDQTAAGGALLAPLAPLHPEGRQTAEMTHGRLPRLEKYMYS